MSKSSKSHEFHFTFKVFLRLLVFIAVVYAAITYFSAASSPLTSSSSHVLGSAIASASAVPQLKTVYDDVYQKLPPSSRQTLENINSSPAIILIQEKIDYLKEESSGFPQKQIADLKKSVVKMIYQEIMKSIDNQ